MIETPDDAQSFGNLAGKVERDAHSSQVDDVAFDLLVRSVDVPLFGALVKLRLQPLLLFRAKGTDMPDAALREGVANPDVAQLRGVMKKVLCLTVSFDVAVDDGIFAHPQISKCMEM